MVGIAARMLHAAHGAQDAHAALGRHLKALNKPSGRVRGVWRGGRQGRRPFQALVDGRRARAANLSGAHGGARREPQWHHPRAWIDPASGRQRRSIFPASAHNLAPGRPIGEDPLGAVERCSRYVATGASRGLQVELANELPTAGAPRGHGVACALGWSACGARVTRGAGCPRRTHRPLTALNQPSGRGRGQ